MVYFFIYIFIILLLFSNVQVKVTNISDKTEIKLKILYLISFKIKSKRFIKQIENLKVAYFDKSLEDLKNIYLNKELIAIILGKIRIKQIEVIYYEDFLTLGLSRAFLVNEGLRVLSNIINTYFYEVKNESYYVKVKDYRDFDFSIIVQINLFNLLYIGIKSALFYHNRKKESRHSYE